MGASSGEFKQEDFSGGFGLDDEDGFGFDAGAVSGLER